MVNRPSIMRPAGTSWKPNGMRQTPYPDLMCMLMPTAGRPRRIDSLVGGYKNDGRETHS